MGLVGNNEPRFVAALRTQNWGDPPCASAPSEKALLTSLSLTHVSNPSCGL